jgi:hypothetical protein
MADRAVFKWSVGGGFLGFTLSVLGAGLWVCTAEGNSELVPSSPSEVFGLLFFLLIVVPLSGIGPLSVLVGFLSGLLSAWLPGYVVFWQRSIYLVALTSVLLLLYYCLKLPVPFNVLPAF